MGKKPKTIKEIGYKNVMIVANSDIMGFGMVTSDDEGKPKTQELQIKKGKNVIQLHSSFADTFIFALRRYADEQIISIKILDI